VGLGSVVAVAAGLAEAGNVGGTSVGGGDGETAAATGFGVAVPAALMFTSDGLFRKNRLTASTMTSTPAASATQGQRLDGSLAPGAVRPIVARVPA
jgi:hypothetical protein